MESKCISPEGCSNPTTDQSGLCYLHRGRMARWMLNRDLLALLPTIASNQVPNPSPPVIISDELLDWAQMTLEDAKSIITFDVPFSSVSRYSPDHPDAQERRDFDTMAARGFDPYGLARLQLGIKSEISELTESLTYDISATRLTCLPGPEKTPYRLNTLLVYRDAPRYRYLWCESVIAEDEHGVIPANRNYLEVSGGQNGSIVWLKRGRPRLLTVVKSGIRHCYSRK